MKTLHLMPARENPASRLLVNSVLPTPGKPVMCIGNAGLQADGDQLDEVGEVHAASREDTIPVVVLPFRHRC